MKKLREELGGNGTAGLTKRRSHSEQEIAFEARPSARMLEGLDDKPGRGRKPSIPDTKVARTVTAATLATPT